MGTTVLRERMHATLRTLNYSPRTEETYVDAVAQYAKHFGRSPDLLGPQEVIAYQLWLRDVRHVSASRFNQVASALRFFYRRVLGHAEMVERIPFARPEKRLPVVLSQEETKRVLESLTVPRYQVLMMTIYATGLRLSEALALCAADIDSARMVIRVRQGKGKKDRYVPLSPVLLTLLREHWKREQLSGLLFPSQSDRTSPLSPTIVQKYMQREMRRIGLNKRVTPRTFRHCYATHLIEQGKSPRVVQVILGHSNVHTTETYMHVSPSTLGKVVSPLDQIFGTPAKP